MARLWRDNMCLRGKELVLTETPPNHPLVEVDRGMPADETLFWCAQCDRRVTTDKITYCLSPFCKAKLVAA